MDQQVDKNEDRDLSDIRCFHCGGRVIWGNDFSFEDYGYEGEGIVHSCSCGCCGADIEYRVSLDQDDDA